MHPKLLPERAAHRAASAVRIACWLSQAAMAGLVLPSFVPTSAAENPSARVVPSPLASHPGNIFVSGEEIGIRLAGSPASYRLLEYDGKVVKEGSFQDGLAALGQLPVGFYRLETSGASNAVSLGVVARLAAPTPINSPIGIDVAMAWFYGEERMGAVANLCALAGVNWVRDRLTWGQMEPRKGEFAPFNKYDASASAQAQAGLRVLQVIHLSPPWANSATKRFPLDLRDAYRFYEAMARRWRGQVHAFEPWNEADIPMFGGHTGAEMASLQKAAYLGLKAGNPEMISCLNVFALHNSAQLEDLQANEAWPYFDTFNLHHYAAFDEYPKLYADFRAVSAGRPLWVTECSLPVRWAGDESLKEPTEADLKVQSERVAKTFACSLHEGSAATFYFLLPHYVEGQTQFGILRPDLTPRPAYLALAAVGRLLAKAEPLGRVKSSDSIRAYLFRAAPDGRVLEVLVAWSNAGTAELDLPVRPLVAHDHLGRVCASSQSLHLTTAPTFAVLSPLSSRSFSVQAPPVRPPKLPGDASPIVLQALWPEEKLDLKQSAYRISSKTNQVISIYAYHFGQQQVRGTFQLTAPAGWTTDFPHEVTLDPRGRLELPLNVVVPESASTSLGTVQIRGDFGTGNKPVLSLRLSAGSGAF